MQKYQCAEFKSVDGMNQIETLNYCFYILFSERLRTFTASSCAIIHRHLAGKASTNQLKKFIDHLYDGLAELRRVVLASKQ